LHELVPIEAIAGPSKCKEEAEMEGAIERVGLESLTILEFKGLGYMYNWVDDVNGWCNEYNLEEMKSNEWLNYSNYFSKEK
jgi:hypothetical protein